MVSGTFVNPTNGDIHFKWVDAATNTALTGGTEGITIPTTYNQFNVGLPPTAKLIITPSANINVKVRTILTTGNSTSNAAGSYATIKQLNPCGGGGTGGAAAYQEPWNVVGTTTPATTNTQNIYQSGNVGVGTPTPGNRLEVNSGTAGSSGLRFTQLNNASPGTANTAPLGVNAAGDVVVAATSQYFHANGNNGNFAVPDAGIIYTDYNTPVSNGITITSGYLNLTPGKTYVLEAAFYISGAPNQNGWMNAQFVTAAAPTTQLAGSNISRSNIQGYDLNLQGTQPVVSAIYTVPAAGGTAAQVGVRLSGTFGPTAVFGLHNYLKVTELR